MVVIKQLMIALTSIVMFSTLNKFNGYRHIFDNSTLQNIVLCVQRLKGIHTGLEQLEGD